jgi:hypothetical protein
MEEGIVATMMTDPCRTFFKEVATPITKCILNHFQNNLSLFTEKQTKNGKIPHSKFKKLCSGMGDCCGINK